MNATRGADPALSQLAEAVGLLEHWTDARKQPQRVGPETLRALLRAMDVDAGDARRARESLRALQAARRQPDFLIASVGEMLSLPPGRPAGKLVREDGRAIACRPVRGGDAGWRLRAPQDPGYYRLQVDERVVTLAVAPARCPTPAALLGEPDPRRWGLAAQVYGLRAPAGGDGAGRDGAGVDGAGAGHGDFAVLARLAERAAAHGADALAISPVHAGFASAPQRYSPYSPSSRLFLNVLYGSPSAVLPRTLAQAAWAETAAQLPPQPPRADEPIDWPAAARLRLAFLGAAYRRLGEAGDDSAAAARQALERFSAEGGQALRDHAVYETLAARHGADWRAWPAPLRDPRSPDTAAFAQAHGQEVDFHLFSQWIAAASLDAAQARARQAGMRIGLIADLAIGTDPRGSQAWSDPRALLAGVSVGAPPDIFNPGGQDWGLTAFSPLGLREQDYGPFLAMLRACLAHAGGVRIDHILGLARMWLVPEGASSAEGVYLRYPMRDLLRLVQLEAWRHKALIVGENLGTVPEGFDDELARSGVLGMDVLWFQRADQPDADAEAKRPAPAPFILPRAWPPAAVAMTTTHDLPTVNGWWRERDIDWRVKLGQLSGEAEQAARAERAADRAALWQALDQAGVRTEGGAVPAAAPELAMLRYVASSACPLALFPLEDLAGETEQPNLPGASDEVHPNWRRRMAGDVETFFDDAGVRARLAAIERGRRHS